MKFAALSALPILAAVALPALADPGTSDQLAELQALKARVANLEAKQTENWLNDERTSQIKAIVADCIADARKREQFLDADFSAGYNNGFYIASADKNYKLQINGYAQFRYTYEHAEVRNARAFSTVPSAGDVNGFDFRRARLYFSGNVFSPDIQYMLSGDFAGTAASAANFQILDDFLAYHFSDLVGIRAGTFLIPFSHVEYATAGLQFTESPYVLAPFDPVRALGISLYGMPIKDKFTYEINANDGSQSNTIGRVDDTAGKLDNRMGFYARLQYAGAGKLADFNDEPDLRKDASSLAWMIAGAAGYESQNSTSNSFPAAQSSMALIGLSKGQGPGFASSAALNGDLYRATVDAHAKYEGIGFTTAAYAQQINDTPPAGSSTDTFTSTFHTSSLFELGYYGQAGYVLPGKIGPGRVEIVGRVGQLLTEGFPNQSEEYAMGVNYYLFGHNAKIQTDVTYIPNEAAYTSTTTATFINTQDIIYRIQLQLKF